VAVRSASDLGVGLPAAVAEWCRAPERSELWISASVIVSAGFCKRLSTLSPQAVAAWWCWLPERLWRTKR